MSGRVATRGYRGERPVSDRTYWMRRIHAEARRLRIDDEARRNLQRTLTGWESCRDMSLGDLRKVAGWLKEIARGNRQARAELTKPISPMTPIGSTVGYVLKRMPRPGRDERLPESEITVEQMRLIDHLFLDLETLNPMLPKSWRTAVCKRVVRKPWPQNRREANALCECLKAMRARNWKPRAAHA